MLESNSAKDNLRKRALVVFVKEIFFQLDEIAHLKKQGFKANLSIGIFREMCSVIKDFEPELLEQYYEVLATLAIRSEPQKRTPFSEEFAAAESPSRKRFITRMRLELTKAA